MKTMFKVTSILVSSAAIFAGCGESYQAIYSGDATFTDYSCGGSAGGVYTMDVQYSSSSPDLSLTVTRFARKDSGISDRLYSWIGGTTINAKYTNGETNFEVQNQTYSNLPDQVSVIGTLSPDKSQISSFTYTRESTIPGTNKPCRVQVSASNLTKKQ